MVKSLHTVEGIPSLRGRKTTYASANKHGGELFSFGGSEAGLETVRETDSRSKREKTAKGGEAYC